MGRLFLERPVRSVEVANGIARLTQQLGALATDGELREYVMAHYLLLYARIGARCTCSPSATSGSSRLIFRRCGKVIDAAQHVATQGENQLYRATTLRKQLFIQ